MQNEADAIRRQVLGDNYVNTTLKDWKPAQPVLDLLENTPWGFLWRAATFAGRTQPGDRGDFGRDGPGKRVAHPHSRARRNGCSFEQIIEVILHAGVYAGMPAAVEGAKIAREIAHEEETASDQQ